MFQINVMKALNVEKFNVNARILVSQPTVLCVLQNRISVLHASPLYNIYKIFEVEKNALPLLRQQEQSTNIVK